MRETADIAQIYRDTSGKLRYRILARNGEIIAQGEAYEHKRDVVDVLEQHFQTASIVDLTELEQ